MFFATVLIIFIYFSGKSRRITWSGVCIFVVQTVLSPNLIQYKQLYQKWYIGFLAIVLLWIMYGIAYLKQSWNNGTALFVIGFEEIFKKETKFLDEQRQREQDYLMSITDALTGAWNL